MFKIIYFELIVNVAGIAKSKGLRESLKELDLSYWGVTREQVDQEMKKRGLVGIEVKII